MSFVQAGEWVEDRMGAWLELPTGRRVKLEARWDELQGLHQLTVEVGLERRLAQQIADEVDAEIVETLSQAAIIGGGE
jgi:hypothetical protein